MIQAEIMWWAIVAVLALAFVVRSVIHRGRHAAGLVPVFKEGEESEMLYVPGDLSDDDAEEFDDL